MFTTTLSDHLLRKLSTGRPAQATKDISMNARIHHLVKTTLNQCFCDFDQKEFTKGYLLSMAKGDNGSLIDCLNAWSSAGDLIITKEVSEASEADVCVRMLRPVEKSPV